MTGCGNGGDGADGVNLVGVDRQHLLPGVRPRRIVRCHTPLVQQVQELLDLGHVRRFARHAVGLVVLPPFRPFQIVLVDGRQLRGAEAGRGQAVLQPRPDRHDAVAGEDPVAEHVAHEGLGEQMDAGLGPAVPDQLQHVRFLRHRAGGIDDDGHLPSIGQQAEAVLVALGQADLVEQLVGRGDIEGGIGLLEFGLVQRAFRQHRIGALPGQAVVDDLVDLMPVDGQRQGAAEAHVAHQLAPHRIAGGQIGEEREAGAIAGLPQHDPVAAVLLAFLEEGVVGEADVLGLQHRIRRRRPSPG